MKITVDLPDSLVSKALEIANGKSLSCLTIKALEELILKTRMLHDADMKPKDDISLPEIDEVDAGDESKETLTSLHQFKYSEIEDAFFHVNLDSYGMNSATIYKDTGKIVFHSAMFDDGEFGEDEEIDEASPLDSGPWVEMPHKNDLNLGRNLVFDFIEKELPNEYDRIENIFRRKGAYSRYKDFLERCGKLDEWHEFQNRREKETLLEWCKDNGITLAD